MARIIDLFPSEISEDRLMNIVTRRYEAPSVRDVEFIEAIAKSCSEDGELNVQKLMDFDLETILSYLKNSHSSYRKNRLPEIGHTIALMKKMKPDAVVLISILEKFFNDYSSHLLDHLLDEDEILFPQVEVLIAAIESDKDKPYIDVDAFKHSHSDTESDLQKVREILRAYKPEIGKFSPYRILLTQLKTFEMDLHIHSRIEEEVLLPKITSIVGC